MVLRVLCQIKICGKDRGSGQSVPLSLIIFSKNYVLLCKFSIIPEDIDGILKEAFNKQKALQSYRELLGQKNTDLCGIVCKLVELHSSSACKVMELLGTLGKLI